MKDAIMDGSRETLRQPGSLTDSVRALAAMVLLQPGADTNALFKQFLELREAGLKSAVGLAGVQAQARCVALNLAGFFFRKLRMASMHSFWSTTVWLISFKPLKPLFTKNLTNR